MPRADATFTLPRWEETAWDEVLDLPTLKRAVIETTYQGDLQGEGRLRYLLMYRNDDTARYVGMERVTGTLDGQRGTFVLEHRGGFDDGRATSNLRIVEGSGTGDLTGIAGNGEAITREEPPYSITLEYQFPD